MVSYVNEGRGPSMIASAVVPLVLTWIFTLGRVYVRRVLLKMWKIENWLFILSELMFTVLAICYIISAIHGNGQHAADIDIADAVIAAKWWFISQLFYIMTSILIRLSIRFFLLRIIGVATVQVWIIRITMVIMTLVSILYFVTLCRTCTPLAYFWLVYAGGKGTCLGNTFLENSTIAYSGFAIATDLTLGGVPLFIVWNLKMNTRTKIVVSFLLGTGILAGLTVIVRIQYVRKATLNPDFLYNASMIVVWSVIEPAIGIISMAASTYHPFFRSRFEKSSTNSPYSSRPINLNGKPISDVISNGHMRDPSNRGYVRQGESSERDLGFEEQIVLGSIDDHVSGGKSLAESFGTEGSGEENQRGILKKMDVDGKSLRVGRA